jgi:hypothetical protein
VTVSNLTHVGTMTERCLFVKKVFPLECSVSDSMSCATQFGNWPQINYCLSYFRSHTHRSKHWHNIKLLLYELIHRIYLYIFMCTEKCWYPVCRVRTDLVLPNLETDHRLITTFFTSDLIYTSQNIGITLNHSYMNWFIGYICIHSCILKSVDIQCAEFKREHEMINSV